MAVRQLSTFVTDWVDPGHVIQSRGLGVSAGRTALLAEASFVYMDLHFKL